MNFPQSLKKYSLPIFLLGVFALMALYKPLVVPPPWFDEGWSLITAKNWAESGVYGIRLGDVWVTANAMSQPLGATLPVALAFKLFGTGLFQARMVTILFSIATLWLIFTIAEKLYSRRVAWLTFFAIFALAPVPSLQILFVGREVLGEIPMLFYLLAGYYCFSKAIEQEKSTGWVLLTALFWGLGIATKKQALPFWGASIALPFLVAFFHKEKKVVRVLTVSTLGAAIVAGGMLAYEANLHSQTLPYGESITAQLYQMAVWTIEPNIRKAAFERFALVGIVSAVALLALIPDIFSLRKRENLSQTRWLELSLFAFSASWIVWFLLGSLGWLRYYLPPHLVAAIFAGKLFDEWLFKTRRKTLAQKVAFYSAITLIMYGFSANLVALRSTAQYTGVPLQQLQAYLEQNISQDKIIESYESELFFLLPDYSFHFPPHSTQVELNHRDLFESDATISYDPLNEDFDYLITGAIEERWHLYQPYINAGNFTLIQDFGEYQLYARK